MPTPTPTPMSDEGRCPTCNKPLTPNEWVGGLCHHCGQAIFREPIR